MSEITNNEILAEKDLILSTVKTYRWNLNNADFIISSNQSVKINGVSHNNAEIPSYLQIKLSFMKHLTNKNSQSLENQFQELIINKIWYKVKLLESNLQVTVSLPSVFQQLKVCKFGNLRIWIISLTNAIS